VAAVVEATLPDLRPRPVRMHSCMSTLTPDQHFAVGQRREPFDPHRFDAPPL
jgi:hypothetical protein